MKLVPVILAGGKGERFWPLSRSRTPKQLLPIIGTATMLEYTIARCSAISDIHETTPPLIITSSSLTELIQQTLGNTHDYTLIGEPTGKNTAPAIALAAAWIASQYKDAFMLVLSADHAIQPVEEFAAAVSAAMTCAHHDDSLVVFGIPPTRPDTNYGYINTGEIKSDFTRALPCYAVQRFVEKPDAETAQTYLQNGSYLWNSGIFLWRNSVIFNEIEKHLPALHSAAQRLSAEGFSTQALSDYYTTAESVSIDYGILEHSGCIRAVRGNFEWDDVGSWDALPRILGTNDEGTTTRGNRIYNALSNDAIIVNDSSGHICSVGADNMVIVATDDVTLVISRDKLSNIKKYLAEIKNRSDFDSALF